MKHFELTNETKIVDGHTVYRIRSTENIGHVKSGTLGGFAESLDNLEDKSFISEDAVIYGNAVAYGNTQISDNAIVCGNAKLYGHSFVSDTAKVYGNAIIKDSVVASNAQVFDNAKVYNNSELYDGVSVYGNAHVTNSMIENSQAINDYTVVSNGQFKYTKEETMAYQTWTPEDPSEVENNDDIKPKEKTLMQIIVQNLIFICVIALAIYIIGNIIY